MTIRVEQNVFLRTLENNHDTSIWFIHGFAESSYSFSDLFFTSLKDHFNLFAPDLPGFGVSPLNTDRTTLADATPLLIELIKSCSPYGRIILVGHSLGSVVCTNLAQQMRDRSIALVSIEGNLTEADAYFSGQAINHTSGEAFKAHFMSQIYKMAADDKAFQRYFASVRQANPDAMMQWGKASHELSKQSVAGKAYNSLGCPTLYYWGATSTPQATQQFIRSAEINHQEFTNSGHWPMIDQPHQCALDLRAFIRSSA